MSERPRIGVLVSGGGRSLENLAERIAAGWLEAELALVVSSKRSAFALERARRLDIPTAHVRRRSHPTVEDFSAEVFEQLDAHRCDVVVLAGWLKLLRLPERWVGRVINIHPALLPAFGGEGFYGDRVHAAVLEHGVQFTGCTVHYVNNEYDAGPIILQRSIEVLREDTVESLGHRVFEQEKIALPEAIKAHLLGEVRYEEGRAVWE